MVTVERSYTGRYLLPLLEAKASAAPVAKAKPKARRKAAKAKAIAAE